MPHKAAAAALADASGPLVSATGAANTLRASRRRVEAANTDVGGIRDASEAAGVPARSPVLVLGAGGAAAAAAAAFRGRVAGVAARRGDRAAALAAAMAPGAAVVAWGQPMPGAVVVNATPLGMREEPLPEGLLEGAAGLVDLAYGGAPTPAVVAAARRGLPYAGGIDVLVAQAARSFTWWTGVPAPREAMARAARAAG
jgi:shikimate dehydrogenase